MEHVFDSRSVALRLVPTSPPGADQGWSLRAREVLVAAADGWRPAIVRSWSWNPTGRPVLWSCRIETDGHDRGWFQYDPKLVRPERWP